MRISPSNSGNAAHVRLGFAAGTNEGPHDAVAVHGVEVGVRCCFYWLSDDAERTLSPAERIKWMEESGKGECQDAAITQTDFASSTGSVFAGELACTRPSPGRAPSLHSIAEGRV